MVMIIYGDFLLVLSQIYEEQKFEHECLVL